MSKNFVKLLEDLENRINEKISHLADAVLGRPADEDDEEEEDDKPKPKKKSWAISATISPPAGTKGMRSQKYLVDLCAHPVSGNQVDWSFIWSSDVCDATLFSVGDPCCKALLTLIKAVGKSQNKSWYRQAKIVPIARVPTVVDEEEDSEDDE